MNPQLMRASRQRPKFDASMISLPRHYLKASKAGLSALPIDLLVRAIFWIAPKWEIDRPCVNIYSTGKHRFINFVNLLFFKLLPE
jgi:hypothetical protein